MFKSLNRACILALAMFAFAFSAQAAPETVVNATGTTAYGVHGIIGFAKNTDSGSNRVAVQYSSGVQYVADTATWTKHAEFAAKCGASCVAVDGSPTGQYYNVASSNGVNCWSSGTILSWPNVAASVQLLGDGCAYWAKVKAL